MRLEIGQKLYIPAWWKNNELIFCEITSISKWLVMVKPLEGNPHIRSYSWSDLKRIFINLVVYNEEM